MAAQRASDEVVDQSKIENRAPSVAAMFINRVATSPSHEAFRYIRPGNGDEWVSVTWSEAGDRVRNLAAGLISLGVQAEQRVALASATRYEWVLADLAVMCAGAATTTVYPTTTAPDVAYIVANSGSRVVIAEDDSQLAKLRDNRTELTDVEKVVLIDGTPGEGDDWVITFEQLHDLGAELLAEKPDAVNERIDAIKPDDLATLIYTSGTTGKPKGVRLPHSAWTYVAAAIDSTGLLDPDDLQYLWLPLSHVFGKVLLVLPLQIGFATAVDGRVDKIVENLAVVRPTFMGAAPRIFEKAYARIVSTVQEEGGVKAKIFDWAIGVGLAVSRAKQAGKSPSLLESVQHALADRLVYSTIRERFGGRLKFFISGSAALNRDVAQWFDAVGIKVLEGYGLSETSAASFVNRPSAYRFGTVGWAIPGTETKIGEDGEILIKGPGVMSGYHENPEATAEALTEDGWFRTGDIGEIDEDGYLRITDRKKDMFKTSNGKYVAPSAVASTFKGICPYVGELIVDGEGKSYCVALISLDAEAIGEWAKHHGMGDKSFSEIAQAQETRNLIGGYVEELNAGLNRWEQIKKFRILDRELTVENGEITPSMKLKRKVVMNNFSDELQDLYN
ncbi:MULTISPECIES: AMP-dependent synthetase/ligase [Rhodococcus]|uniref:Acyl-CoA synthetase n=1 Tax=Rhodococcus oxybenzonivorans TaxID=1990687 RepID=A0AAE4V6Q4_9NOCA|nr:MULTISPECIES: long-chain fatty acid--CoA ligase [Rhodococcus]MDV7243432.1 long-chain fatty acid--CoA ligase [Rhodococcus oxybenzonivorans]MDV7268649.1 long-chain fatty acid--CoA ligase [Rhodococcus oxybenzonivorans]MDV7276858.1 long-chain fatty acid--CoA ligase [Rhodococcus oxybenzonivorans]MDV7334308.1 long-chain fatty acid--CoA ligase [Rhodococcus oxybenzonivorans]MDV7344463.1 long-chain fatty acid--CoA ligase [Rhodococcus oxybenzonivorans]